MRCLFYPIIYIQSNFGGTISTFSLSNRQKPSLLGLCYCEKTTKFIEHKISLFQEPITNPILKLKKLLLFPKCMYSVVNRHFLKTSNPILGEKAAFV